jgi:ethanolamine utilization protein EutN
VNLHRVIGTVWASAKVEGSDGLKMQLVQPVDAAGEPAGPPRVAFDSVGAGPGELVFTVAQYEATLPFPDRPLVPIDLTIVGIVDTVEDQSAAVLGSADRGEAGS